MQCTQMVLKDPVHVCILTKNKSTCFRSKDIESPQKVFLQKILRNAMLYIAMEYQISHARKCKGEQKAAIPLGLLGRRFFRKYFKKYLAGRSMAEMEGPIM
ncbi:hypothetical protein TNCV_4695421 [Trichonephila clavipes]|nr:hypothetical protein TNCV_4695421 [Trichonephila clavipes]